MSKSDNLKDYLTDLYRGIASKKPNASKNPQDFRSEIEAIETGVPEWDGVLTIIKSEYTISSGWVTVANQGLYKVEGELTVGTSTVAFLEIALGLNYGADAGAAANYISVGNEKGWHSIDNTTAFTLKITGGDDMGNADLIAWLESDGQDTGVSLISFTIDGVTYYSPEGWTWAEWVADTTYNTGGYKVSGTMIYFGTKHLAYNSGSAIYIVYTNEDIINGRDYILYEMTSG